MSVCVYMWCMYVQVYDCVFTCVYKLCVYVCMCMGNLMQVCIHVCWIVVYLYAWLYLKVNVDNRCDRHMIRDDDVDTASPLTDKEQFSKEDLLPVDQEDEETDKV